MEGGSKKIKRDGSSSLWDLLADVLVYMLTSTGFLGLFDIINLSRVNKFFHTLVDKKLVWDKLFLSLFGKSDLELAKSYNMSLPLRRLVSWTKGIEMIKKDLPVYKFKRTGSVGREQSFRISRLSYFGSRLECGKFLEGSSECEEAEQLKKIYKARAAVWLWSCWERNGIVWWKLICTTRGHFIYETIARLYYWAITHGFRLVTPSSASPVAIPE